jgi:hypothetical protein
MSLLMEAQFVILPSAAMHRLRAEGRRRRVSSAVTPIDNCHTPSV